MKRMVLVAVLFSIMAGCSGPEDALTKYLDALSQGDYVAAYQLVCSQDKSAKNFQSYMRESSGERSALRLALATRTSYKIKSVKKEGGQAVVTVAVTAPDFDAVYYEVFGPEYSGAEKISRNKIEKMIAETYQGRELPIKSFAQDYTLFKEDDGWKVFLDWGKGKQIEEMIAEAREFQARNELQAGRDKYAEILELSPENAVAPAKIAELDQKLARQAERLAYAQSLSFSNVSVEQTRVGLGLFVDIKNNGGRELKMVEVTITFLDREGRALAEKIFRPVDFKENLRIPDNVTLPSGKSKRFGVRVDDAPEGWSQKVQITIRDLEFAE